MKERKLAPSELARYIFEHDAFPQMFYKLGRSLSASLLAEKGQLISELSSELFANFDPGWKAEDFTVVPRIYALDEDTISIVRITMPMPKNVMDCSHIYLCSSRNGERNKYITCELSASGKYLFCCWTEDRTHIAYGPINGLDDFDIVRRLVQNR